MKKRSLLLIPLLLTACVGGSKPVDGRKFLDSLDGPKVPTVQDSLTESAKDAEKQGNFRQAAEIYQQILEKHPDDKNIIMSLADAYRRSGQLDQSIAVYDSLIEKDPAFVAAKEGKGLALLAKGDFETPTALFEDVMKSDPKRWKTLNALGILFAARDLNREAQAYFDEALKYNPGSVSVLNNSGLSQAINGHYDLALISLNRASSLAPVGSPEIKRVNLNAAAVYAISGKLEEARAIAEKYYTGAALDNNMGIYAHLAKDDQLAKTYLNMALTESKVYYPKAWDNLQDISGNTGDTATSNSAVSIVPATPAATPTAPQEPTPTPKPVTHEPKPVPPPALPTMPPLPTNIPPTE